MLRLPWLLAPALMVLACAGASAEDPICSAESALIGGVPRTTYLQHGSEVERSIGVIESGDVEAVCVGTRVAKRWVLSAAHCAHFSEPRFVIPGASPIRILRVEAHASRDLALFELDDDACGAASLTHLPLARFGTEPGLAATRLSRATIAGLADGGPPRALAYLIEPVVGLDERYVVVDGRGNTGACFGDSGGPLLVRDETGEVAVLGALSTGDSSCRGLDYYERVDGVFDWVMQVTGEPSAPPQGCGGVEEAGRCFDGMAVWCEALNLRARSCGAQGCGWSAADEGYRCAESLPCEGDEIGQCTSAGSISACRRDGAHQEFCTNGCGYDPQSGVAHCD